MVNEMNNRELLELAAKAAGYRVWVKEVTVRIWHPNTEWTTWNPLTDDGDALRLAVNLFIQIYPGKDEVEIFHMEIGYVVEPTNGDVIDATRRAIVRAAAEIGRQMQEGGAA